MAYWMWLTDRLRRWQALAPGESNLFLRSALLLPWVVIALRLFGLQRVQAALAQLSGTAPGRRRKAQPPIEPRSAERLAVLCRAAGRMIPGANCLACSLTTWTLLRNQGYPTELRIGVRRTNGEFQAHAWLEKCGQPLIAPAPCNEAFAAFDHSFEPLTSPRLPRVPIK
jgi:hypothetical protein